MERQKAAIMHALMRRDLLPTDTQIADNEEYGTQPIQTGVDVRQDGGVEHDEIIPGQARWSGGRLPTRRD